MPRRSFDFYPSFTALILSNSTENCGFDGFFACNPHDGACFRATNAALFAGFIRKRPEKRMFLGFNDVVFGCKPIRIRGTTMAKAAAPAKTSAKAPAKAAAKIETVTLKHIAATLAEAHEIPKKQSVALLEDLVAQISKHLKKGARIRIGGLGVLQVRKRPARMGRNPATGEAIKIKASKKIAFRAAKELKESV
jgi:DNA-binding protein HU-beta